MFDRRHTKNILVLALFSLCVILNFAFWRHSREILPAWNNVPPAPSETVSAMGGLGDQGVAYRMSGYAIQNFGNVGGRFESLKNYDYATLEKWFFAAQKLDERGNYIPFLAAYYYGAVEEKPEALRHIISFLRADGARPYPQKWRWLAHAAYLARYKLNDLPWSLELARELAALPAEDMAPWARQMPAFVQLQMGNKEAAYEIMVRMLATEKDKLHPNEVNEMVRFICTRALDNAQASQNPLCQKTP